MHGRKKPLSEARILSELSRVAVSVIVERSTGRHFAVPSAVDHAQVSLYKAVCQVLQRATVPLKEESGA